MPLSWYVESRRSKLLWEHFEEEVQHQRVLTANKSLPQHVVDIYLPTCLLTWTPDAGRNTSSNFQTPFPHNRALHHPDHCSTPSLNEQVLPAAIFWGSFHPPNWAHWGSSLRFLSLCLVSDGVVLLQEIERDEMSNLAKLQWFVSWTVELAGIAKTVNTVKSWFRCKLVPTFSSYFDLVQAGN